MREVQSWAWARPFAPRLLLFAVRVYTRAFPKGDARLLLADRTADLPEQRYFIDNGERSVIVSIRYGPIWDE